MKYSKKLPTTSHFQDSPLHPTCFRPDLYLNQGRCCDGCPYYPDCRCDLRRLRSETPAEELD
jgi:hypothetical protein